MSAQDERYARHIEVAREHGWYAVYNTATGLWEETDTENGQVDLNRADAFLETGEDHGPGGVDHGVTIEQQQEGS